MGAIRECARLEAEGPVRCHSPQVHCSAVPVPGMTHSPADPTWSSASPPAE